MIQLTLLVIERPGMGLISNLFGKPDGHREGVRGADFPIFLLRFTLLTTGYALVARLSIAFAVIPGIASSLWLPSAIALCACLAWGVRMAPAVWLGAMLALADRDIPLAGSALMAAGGMAGAIIATLLVQRLYRARTDFIYLAPPYRFIAIALFSSMISAGAGTFGLATSAQTAATPAPILFLVWWLGDTAGLVIGVPLILAWNLRRGIRWRPGKLVEIAAFAILLPLIAQGIFGGSFGNWPLAYLVMPLFLWAAVRFNLTAVAWTTAVTCAVAVWNTAHGHGPFADSDMTVSLLLVMLYVIVTGSIGLVMSNLVYQRSSAESLLREERDDRERHVLDRTHTLVNDIEERKRIEHKLAARERQLAEAQHLAQLGSWNWNLDTDEIAWSDELYRIFGVDRGTFTVTQESIRNLIHQDGYEKLRESVRGSRESGEPFQVEYGITLPDGSSRIVAARGQPQYDGNGRMVRMVGTVQDITDAKKAEASLREAEERYRKVVELSPDAILVQQDGVFVYANPAALRLLGAARMSEIVGKPMFDFVHPDFHALVRQRIACLQRGDTLSAAEERLIRLDRSEVDVEVSSSPFLHGGHFASLYIMRDITERKRTAEQMVYLAHFDSLTGLPNRMLFHQRLEHALNIAERPGRSLEVLFLDLDRFKHINDTLGHATGDRVLKEAASRLQSILRESDTVARLGGDEFVVLVENIGEPHRGGIIAEKILSAFSPPFLRDEEPLNVSTSIGIASFPNDGTDSETLLKNADIAMYRAKETGRHTYRYFSPEMNEHAAERLALENALGRAIELGQLSLHYQPKIDILTNRITGMEALLRWDHPTLGSMAPARFLSVAEESGLIRPIGYWVIRTACAQNREWQRASPVRLRVAVNLSAKQLSDNRLADNIDAILAETELDAQYLELEVSESAVMADPERAIGVLNKLRDRGISIAMDNFGIGNSSLAYLKRFPIRAVKIDHSFVQGLPYNSDDSAITKAIITLAHSLECSVIAEGAETQQQFDFLRDNDCDSVQGFYFSAPMPAEHFEDLIKVQSKLHLH
ncbi:EAL domain-containing protein [Noviherbaspirillum sp. ST9]|uniref:bifunctional diguanylate cyclase/phosphodiesterase n=1 Tax=Noviherbaspirillum sp. ST9 TaxID=3401606 RepID=UPI003B589A13